MTTIYHSEGKFQGVGGIDLYYQSWYPEAEVRGILTIVHGLGAHSGRYGNIIEHLIPKQYAIYALDLRGHGKSAGQRGHIHSWAEFRDDLLAFLQFVQTQQPKCPIFLLGHSLGSVVVLDYVLQHPQAASVLQGVILLAPSLGKVGVAKIKLLIGYLLSRVLPRFTLDSGLDLSAASRDEKVIAAYAQDTLRHTRASARLATEFFATVARIHAQAANWQLPLLILHGTGDRIAAPGGGQAFYEKVTYKDKTRIEYPGAYHELQSDINYQEVLADLTNWLERCL